MLALWPHQESGIGETLLAIENGARRILLCSPTGGGKTRMVTELIERWLDDGLRIVLYSNRRLLIDQLSGVLTSAGLEHGVRAAGHEDMRHLPLQISSIQTEGTRALRGDRWELHAAQRVVVDEAHLQKGDDAREIMAKHTEAGAVILGVTATPLGIGDLYDHLIIAGTNGQLRACGALVPAIHYGCDEPDLAAWKKAKQLTGWTEGEDMSERMAAKVMMTNGIFGRVLDWFVKLNPTHRPTLLFAPGVKESLWFAEQFYAAGITAAHIDGQDVWVNGKMSRSSPEARQEVLNGSKKGAITVLCNRFVLREGIDAPWLVHGVFATIFGSVQSYLQSGGRLLRNDGASTTVTVQDHGGNWWRHGSLNADRIWTLGLTASDAHALRDLKLRRRTCWKCQAPLLPRRPLCVRCGALNEIEPTCCPKCGKIVNGPQCACGWQAGKEKIGRAVVQCDGQLRQMHGEIYRPHRICSASNGPAIWERMYWRSRTAKGRRTFRAAMSLFAQENHWGWPSPNWPFMPRDDGDFLRLVEAVPMEALIPKP